MADLPDFDTLLAMHQEDPDALDQLRQKLTAELVDSAPDDARRRLEGLQFRINMELRRAGNPTARFLKLSGMMHKSFSDLRYCLSHPMEAVSARQTHRKADILPLNRTGRPGTSGHRPSSEPTDPHQQH